MKYALTFYALLSIGHAQGCDIAFEKIEDVRALEACLQPPKVYDASLATPILPLCTRGELYAALAEFYLFGPAAHRNDEKAMSYAKRAVEEGEASGFEILGGIYLHGYGVKKDIKHAVHYYEMGAMQGQGPCQFNLGIIYKNGEDIPQDFKKSYFWFYLATLNDASLGEMVHDTATYRSEIAQHLDEPTRMEQAQKAIRMHQYTARHILKRSASNRTK